jgi:hypothetical protein
LIVSICFQQYIYLGTRTLARTQGILTELVFEHSLRIRFKAESSEGRTPSPSTTVTPAPASETGSEDSETAGGDDGQSSTAYSESSAAAKGKGKADPEESAKEAKKKDNLIGKINTLVTVDVDNITNAKDILMLGQCCIHSTYGCC